MRAINYIASTVQPCGTCLYQTQLLFLFLPLLLSLFLFLSHSLSPFLLPLISLSPSLPPTLISPPSLPLSLNLYLTHVSLFLSLPPLISLSLSLPPSLNLSSLSPSLSRAVQIVYTNLVDRGSLGARYSTRQEQRTGQHHPLGDAWSTGRYLIALCESTLNLLPTLFESTPHLNSLPSYSISLCIIPLILSLRVSFYASESRVRTEV